VAKAPLPEKLPGEFFVLEWNRLRETFVIHVEDAQLSSYDLGGVIEKVMLRFELWGHKEIGMQAIDIARSFGAAKCLVPLQRVVPLFDRADARSKAVRFEETPE